jgi:hypothetical protein
LIERFERLGLVYNSPQSFREGKATVLELVLSPPPSTVHQRIY